jgi:putative ABC transport system permease protein
MRFAYLVFSNLKRKKTRTALTFLSVLIAFVLFGYLAAIGTALEFGVSVAGADRLVVRHKVSLIQPLPESYEARMEGIDHIVEATHATWFGGVYQNPRNFFAQFPVKPLEYLGIYPEFQLPEDQLEAWLSTRTGAIAGRAIADQFGWKVGDRIPIQATIWFKRDGTRLWEFDLVGIYDGEDQATDTSQFLFRYDYFDESRQEGARGLVGWYIVQVDDPDNAVEVAGAIDAMFANSPAETSAETELAFVQGFANQVGNIGAIITGVLSAVFFTILLVAGNTMAQAVRERIEEIGVLKAIGFTHGQVLGLVLVEACLLAGGAGLVGLGVGYMLISMGDPTGGAFPVFFFPPDDIAKGALIALLLGLAAGALPALQAMRLETAAALRRH